MAYWMDGLLFRGFGVLLEAPVVSACDSLWLYHNLVGMVARKVDPSIDRAARAYERSLELDPSRADTLYNFANLIKDDNPERAATLYLRSLALEPAAPILA